MICAHHLVPRGKQITGFPIGRRMQNAALCVRDAAGQIVPTGVPGELYIGGHGVTRGYYLRDELNREKYVQRDGRRWYRSGDLVRQLQDGTLEFLGRIDDQVKIRGFRIELGEIEQALMQHESVRDAAVVVQEPVAGDKQLVGYVVPLPGKLLDRAELRRSLQKCLPEYMVPSHLLAIDKIPLNANGKVDRRALPAPQWSEEERDSLFVAPRDALEREIVRVWSRVLGRPNIGITDNFFNLGGHSLQAVRLMAELKKQFGVTLPLSVLYQEGTVEAVARSLRAGDAWRDFASLVPLSLPMGADRPEGERQLPLFLVHPVGGVAHVYAELAQGLTPHPVYALQSRGLAGDVEVSASVEEMAALYLREMRSVQAQGPYLLGGWSFGGVVAYEIAQQLIAQGEQVALVAMIDAVVPTPEQQRVAGGAEGEAARSHTDQEQEERMALLAFAQDFARRGGLDIEPFLDHFNGNVTAIAAEELFEQLLSTMRRENAALAADVELAHLLDLFAIFQANDRAYRSYSPLPSTVELTLFRAEAGAVRRHPDPTLGWGSLVPNVELRDVPGDHYTAFQMPHLAMLTKSLQDRLAEYVAVHTDR